MPTLTRLLFVLGIVAAAGYAAMSAIAGLATPPRREIEETVSLPPSIETRTGRSAAEMLNRQAAALVRHRKHGRQTAPAR